MKKFIANSYQLRESLKWVPFGDIIEDFENGSGTYQQHPITDKEFDSKEEADKFFTEYLKNLGFHDMKSENSIIK